jgi:hypothetical protein
MSFYLEHHHLFTNGTLLCYFHFISEGIEKEKQKNLLERRAFLLANLDFMALDHVLKFKKYCVVPLEAT